LKVQDHADIVPDGRSSNSKRASLSLNCNFSVHIKCFVVVISHVVNVMDNSMPAWAWLTALSK